MIITEYGVYAVMFCRFFGLFERELVGGIQILSKTEVQEWLQRNCGKGFGRKLKDGVKDRRQSPQLLRV